MYRTGGLDPLSTILKKNSDPNSMSQLTEAAGQVPTQVEYAIQKHQILIIISLGKHVYYL